MTTIRLFESYPAPAISDEELEELSEIFGLKDRPEPKEKPGWIYFLRGPDGICKIGKSTREPDLRIAEYSPQLPFETELAFMMQVSNCDVAEKYLHAVFQLRHIRGEWFKISDADILAVAQNCIGLVFIS